MDHAAAAVGEGEEKLGCAAREEDENGARPFAAVGRRFRRTELEQKHREVGDVVRRAPAAARTACVTWHPASARLVYAEGDSLFVEDLESCRRWELTDSGRPGDHQPTVVVSSGGDFVARGFLHAGPNGSRGSLSIWRLGHDVRQLHSRAHGGGGGGSDAESKLRHAARLVLDERDVDEGGVVALAFSPSGSELCSVGEWDGTRCLLEIRSTSTSTASYKTAAAVAGTSGRPRSAVSVRSLAAKTSAICVLPEHEEGEAGDESFLFATGGEGGVALWRRFCGGDPDMPPPRAGVGAVGGSAAEGGVRLLGTLGVRATVLTSAGRFIVAAELSGVGGNASVTAIDASWLAAGGYEGDGVCDGCPCCPVMYWCYFWE